MFLARLEPELSTLASESLIVSTKDSDAVDQYVVLSGRSSALDKLE